MTIIVSQPIVPQLLLKLDLLVLSFHYHLFFDVLCIYLLFWYDKLSQWKKTLPNVSALFSIPPNKTFKTLFWGKMTYYIFASKMLKRLFLHSTLDFEACTPTSCQNGGTCLSYTGCLCTFDYIGETCEIPYPQGDIPHPDSPPIPGSVCHLGMSLY